MLPNRDSQIVFDLSKKLMVDIAEATIRYVELCNSAEIPGNAMMGGIHYAILEFLVKFFNGDYERIHEIIELYRNTRKPRVQKEEPKCQ